MGEYFGMKKCSFLIFTVLFFTLNVFAQQNIISSVTISKSKEDASKYELSIDSTDAVHYKMHKDSQGVWFELKNSILAKNAGTIYNDVSDIDSVSVKSTKNGRVNIYLQGKNLENTELVFANSLFDTVEDTKKQITLAAPISDYQQTDYSDDLEDIGAEWSNNNFSFSHLGLNILDSLKKGPFGIVLIFLAAFAIFAIIIKTITQRLSQDSEPLIGLNNNYNKEDELIRDLSRTRTLQDAQAELTKAHSRYQDYLKNKYQSNVKAPNVDMVKKSIALNQYQKATENPYKDQEVIRINKDYTTRDNFQIPPRPKAQKPLNTAKNAKTEFTSPYIKRTAGNVEYKTKKSEQTTSNMKFLESVTKIYEQSGRNDLAQELKSSMSKIK